MFTTARVLPIIGKVILPLAFLTGGCAPSDDQKPAGTLPPRPQLQIGEKSISELIREAHSPSHKTSADATEEIIRRANSETGLTDSEWLELASAVRSELRGNRATILSDCADKLPFNLVLAILLHRTEGDTSKQQDLLVLANQINTQLLLFSFTYPLPDNCSFNLGSTLEECDPDAALICAQLIACCPQTKYLYSLLNAPAFGTLTLKNYYNWADVRRAGFAALGTCNQLREDPQLEARAKECLISGLNDYAPRASCSAAQAIIELWPDEAESILAQHLVGSSDDLLNQLILEYLESLGQAKHRPVTKHLQKFVTNTSGLKSPTWRQPLQRENLSLARKIIAQQQPGASE